MKAMLPHKIMPARINVLRLDHAMVSRQPNIVIARNDKNEAVQNLCLLYMLYVYFYSGLPVTVIFLGEKCRILPQDEE